MRLLLVIQLLILAYILVDMNSASKEHVLIKTKLWSMIKSEVSATKGLSNDLQRITSNRESAEFYSLRLSHLASKINGINGLQEEYKYSEYLNLIQSLSGYKQEVKDSLNALRNNFAWRYIYLPNVPIDGMELLLRDDTEYMKYQWSFLDGSSMNGKCIELGDTKLNNLTRLTVEKKIANGEIKHFQVVFDRNVD